MDTANAQPQSSNTGIAPPHAGNSAGLGYGGDSGVGFHSRQPIPGFRSDPTEQTWTKTKLNDDEEGYKDPFIPAYPKWHASPFERYVPRPTSNGQLPPGVSTYKPEDRSTMGVPLNPFWIRNGSTWHPSEADIFEDVNISWVAPRVNIDAPQASQGFDRDNYLNNEEQPQNSSEASDLKKGAKAPDTKAEAGSVTGTGDAAAMGEVKIGGANPADTQVADVVGKEAKPAVNGKKEKSVAEKRKNSTKGETQKGQKKPKETKVTADD